MVPKVLQTLMATAKLFSVELAAGVLVVFSKNRMTESSGTHLKEVIAVATVAVFVLVTVVPWSLYAYTVSLSIRPNQFSRGINSQFNREVNSRIYSYSENCKETFENAHNYGMSAD